MDSIKRYEYFEYMELYESCKNFNIMQEGTRYDESVNIVLKIKEKLNLIIIDNILD